MIKILTVMMIINTSFCNLYSQTKERNKIVNLSTGPSFPIGTFATNSFKNYYSGAEMTFSNYSISFNYLFYKNSGLSVGYFSTDNSIIGSRTFGFSGIAIGPIKTFNLFKNCSFDLKIDFDYILSVIETESDLFKADGIGFRIHSAVRYAIFERWNLIGSATYLNSTQKFKSIHDKKIQTINLEFGLGFMF